MKTIAGIILVLAMAFLPACQGVPGNDGLDGEALLGSVFEIEGDFTSANDWTIYFKFPNTVKVYESDIVLVYILWGQTTNSAGKKLDVWRLLPQTAIIGDKILQYNYDFTLSDVEIFLDGSINLNTLLASEALDQVFRIVVLPAEFALKNSINMSNYNLVLKSLGVNPLSIEKIDITNMSKAPSPN